MEWRAAVLATSAAALVATGCGSVRDPDPVADAPPSPAGDAALDAAARPLQFDVAYVDALTLPPDTSSVFGFAVIVNTGTQPLRLSTAAVVSMTDDDATIDWVFAREVESSTSLMPGRAGGYLTLLAKSKLLVDGVVDEPLSDEILTFSMSLGVPQPAGTSFLAQAVLEVEGRRATLPFAIKVASGDLVFDSVRRVPAQP